MPDKSRFLGVLWAVSILGILGPASSSWACSYSERSVAQQAIYKQTRASFGGLFWWTALRQDQFPLRMWQEENDAIYLMEYDDVVFIEGAMGIPVPDVPPGTRLRALFLNADDFQQETVFEVVDEPWPAITDFEVLNISYLTERKVVPDNPCYLGFEPLQEATFLTVAIEINAPEAARDGRLLARVTSSTSDYDQVQLSSTASWPSRLPPMTGHVLLDIFYEGETAFDVHFYDAATGEYLERVELRFDIERRQEAGINVFKWGWGCHATSPSTSGLFALLLAAFGLRRRRRR